MKTYLECYPCFLKQALRVAEVASLDMATRERVVKELLRHLHETPADCSPPRVMAEFYDFIRETSGNDDVYGEIKKQSTVDALNRYGVIKGVVETAADPLSMALKVAGVGNIIDFGAPVEIDLDKEVVGIPSLLFDQSDIQGFAGKLAISKTLLYIGDNAGETVFDRVLLEELRRLFPKVEVTFAVRGQAVINDALPEDAPDAGLGDVCRIISSGSRIPGIEWEQCTAEFRALFNDADMVLSKGQGNYETISGETDRQIYYLLRVKCDVVANHIGSPVGSLVFRREG